MIGVVRPVWTGSSRGVERTYSHLGEGTLLLCRVEAIPEGLAVAGALPGRVGGDDYRKALVQILQASNFVKRIENWHPSSS
jgi:hypothetical protein